MALSKTRWKRFAESRYPHEREALEFLAQGLPDSDPNLIYTNFEFIADDGSVNEVDALVITRAGVFMVEAKSRGGIVFGNRHSWDWEKDGRILAVDSPLILANAKARKLAGLIGKQRAFRNERRPWVEALVFLSAPGISVRLPDSERMAICEREPRDKSPGILPALLQREYFGSIPARGVAIDRPAAKRVAQALEEAGIRPSQRQRRVGDYVLQNLIEENPLFACQDFHAEHPTTHAIRRVRLYTVAGTETGTRDSVRRGALQEYQILETLDHPGILRALDFQEHELGPAILFRRESDEIRLDHFLRQRGPTLSLDVRLDLVRQIADAVRYAHSHRVIHRALSPKSILVVQPNSDHPQVRLFNWQAGRLLASGSSSGSPASRSTTLHPSQYSEESSLVYLAPESILDPRGRDPMADVFSLGAIAYHIVSGRTPAGSAAELNQILTEHKGLPLAAALDGATPCLQELIREATSPDLMLRTENAADFLAGIEEVWEELTGPPQESLANPLDAKPGELLPFGLKVQKRLGGGSTAVALLVNKGEETFVLKVARRADDNSRVEAEHRTLEKLTHPLIVKAGELLHFPEGHSGFLMEYAGKGTLAQELKEVGRLSLEFLQRYGEDLLQVAQYLEEMGVAHRDLKPDNIGIQEYGKNLQKRLKVFDFSLSGAPLDQVRAGTPPYLEPFLQLPGRGRWDTAAERYAVAVILYEMATGGTPRWGDSQSAPHLIADDVTIDSDLFDAPVRDSLFTFFGKAFERDPRCRFDNALDMLAAWHNVFARAAATDSRSTDETAQRIALDSVRPDTLVSQLGVSTRAQNTLDRLGIFTAQELAAQPPGRFSSLRGVGNKTRREVMDLIGKLRIRLPQTPIPDRAALLGKAVETTEERESDQPSAALSIDALTTVLIPVESGASGKVARQILAQFLELDDASSGLPVYPTQAQIAESTKKARAQISQILTKARERWRRTPALTTVRNELAEFVSAEGGVVEVGELTQFLLTSRGSDAGTPLASRRAAAVLRTALEAEKLSETNRFEERRSNGRFLIARSEAPFGETALDYAEKLAASASQLASTEPLPSPARVQEGLRAIPSPVPALRDSRLVRLAASVAQVAVSTRQELYPRGLDALRALKLAQSAVAGLSRVTTDDLRDRVRERYPEAAELPDRPALDELVREAGLSLIWQNAAGAYVAPAPPAVPSSVSVHRQETVVSASVFVPPIEVPLDIEEAQKFERRIQAAYRAPSYLVLATDPKIGHIKAALDNIARHFPMTVFDCEREMLAALHAEAGQVRVRWEVVLRADATAPESRDMQNLRKLAEKAARKVADQLRQRQEPTLLLFPGLLARYGQLNVLDELQDSLGDKSLWVLVGSEGRGNPPSSEKQPIPARPTQWAWIPEKWLDNDFRKYRINSRSDKEASYRA
jgi:serine/threonine protein kinase